MSRKKKSDFYSNNGIDEQYDDEIDSFEEEMQNKRSGVLSKLIPNKENKEYTTTVYRGFIWIFMVLTSFLAVFLIFKIPYYEYYNQTTPIVVEEGSVISNNPEQGFSDFSNIDTLERDFGRVANEKVANNSTKSSNNKSTQDGSVTSKNSSLKQNNADSNFVASVSNSGANNKKQLDDTLMVDEQKLEDLLVSNNDASQSKANTTKSDNSSLVKKGSESDITKILQDTKSNMAVSGSSGNSTKQVLNFTKGGNSSNKGVEIEVVKKNSPKEIDIRVVWVVNIFSTINQSVLPEKLTQIVSGKEDIFKNSTFYFTEYLLNGRKNYRISVVGTKQAQGGVIAYSKQQDAAAFCQTLRNNSIDCFASSISSNLLSPVKR